jgi:hypothetical protein
MSRIFRSHPVAEPGGQGASCPLAPLPERMAPLGRLVRRPPRVIKYATVAPQENFYAPWVETLAPPLVSPQQR